MKPPTTILATLILLPTLNPITHTVNNSVLLNSHQTFTILNPVGLLFLAGALNLDGKDLTFDVTSTSEAQVQGVINGAGGLIKTGAGTLTLCANNTYTGTTTLNGGTLQVNGSQPGSAIVLGAGTLKGTGTVGALTAAGSSGRGSIVLSPGGSPGILSSSNVVLDTNTTFVAELNGTTPGASYDQLNVTGSVKRAPFLLPPTLTAATGRCVRRFDSMSRWGGGNTILFSSIVPGTITLMNPLGELFISVDVTTIGPGVNGLVIRGNSSHRVFHLTNNASVSISGLTISGGVAPQLGHGGGILQDPGALVPLHSERFPGRG